MKVFYCCVSFSLAFSAVACASDRESSDAVPTAANECPNAKADRATLRSLYRGLEREERASIWREHLKTKGENFVHTTEQQMFLQHIQARLPEILDDAAAVQRENSRMVELFGDLVARQLLGEDAIEGLLAERAVRLRSPKQMKVLSTSSFGGGVCGDRWSCSDECDCDNSDNPGYCSQGEADRTCAQTNNGCGFLWSEPCTCNQTQTRVRSCGGHTTLVGP